MKILLINGSSTPLYEQIVQAIKENILEGQLAEDEQLPSVRRLSADLKVSILTVKKAYDQLEEEGFLVSRQGLGTFVASLQASMLTEEKQKEIEDHLLRACTLAKEIELSQESLTELLSFIYEGDG